MSLNLLFRLSYPNYNLLEEMNCYFAVSATKLDCSDIQSINPDAPNGVYTIKPEGLSSLRVYCDMTTDGGGWLVSICFCKLHMSRQLTCLKISGNHFSLGRGFHKG